MRALIVEDDRTVREILTTALTDYGFCCVAETETANAARDTLKVSGPFDVYFVDLVLPGAHGTCFIEALPRACRSKVLVITGRQDESVYFMCESLGLIKRQIVLKPFDLDCLLRKVTEIVEAGSVYDARADRITG